MVLTGAGISAESGIPTFRGSGGLWRKYRSESLATLAAFEKSPSLIWEFYHYRRELILTKKPNKAHYAVAEHERRCKKKGGIVTVVTQNIDGLHIMAGSKNVIELHGSLFQTRCLKCGDICENRDSPICPALKDKGAPDVDNFEEIPVSNLPHCCKDECNGLLRPNVVWFGENLNPNVLQKTEQILEACDACLVVGTSSVVYPAASFAPRLLQRGVVVAEFNIEPKHNRNLSELEYYFEGPCTKTIPEVLSVE